jgi:hypothetical protein
MKRTLLFFLISSALLVKAQDATWFSDITASSGLENQKMQKAYAVDVNGDGYIDIVTITGVDYFNNRKPMRLFMNEANPANGDRHFVDKTEWSNINSNVNPADTGRQTTCAAFADVDNDGDADMVTAHYFHRIENYKDVGDRCQVLLNDGTGRFSIKENNGLDKLGLVNTQGLSFLDYDLDGNVDLFIGNWFSDYTNNVIQDDILMKGNGNGTFTNVTGFTNINKPTNEPLYGSNAGDWNNDGWTDIFSASYCRTSGSLWKNNRLGNFDNVAKTVGYTSQLLKGDNGQELCHWAAMPSDYDNDGDFDFYFALVHGGNDLNEGRSTIVNNRGADSNYRLRWMMDITPRAVPRAAHIATYDANWFDFDNDGLTDLCNADGTYAGGGNGRIFFFRQNPDHKFTDISKALTLTGTRFNTMYIVRPIDYDNDGDEDLLTYGGGTAAVPIFLKNNAGNKYNHVVINLEPAFGTNRSAVGARVMVHTGNVVHTREVYAGQGNASGQAPFSLVFGLGQSAIIDSVVVIFPNKAHRKIVKTNLDVNKTYTIYEYIGQLPESDFVIYPNPVGNETKVAFPDTYLGNTTFRLMDVNGKVISEETVNLNYNYKVIDTSNLAPGCYFLQLSNASGVSKTKRLLKQ